MVERFVPEGKLAMFSVGDWEGIDLTDDQKLLAHELATLAIELKEQQLTLAKMRLDLLNSPTSQMQGLCEEYSAQRVEPIFSQMIDPAMRLLGTVIDQAEMVELVGVARDSLKKRVLQRLSQPIENAVEVLMGPLFVSLQKGDLTRFTTALGKAINLDRDSLSGFVTDNVNELTPMLLQLAAQGVNVPILLFVAECFGLPTNRVKQQLQKLAREGLPRSS